MVEVLLNWLVMLSLLGILALFVLIAFWDLRGGFETRPAAAPSFAEPAAVVGSRRAMLEYSREGSVMHCQPVTDAVPAYIGTEFLPDLGAGCLVRHVQIIWNDDGLIGENRDSRRPISWRSSGGQAGEAPAFEPFPLDNGTALHVGDWSVTCRIE